MRFTLPLMVHSNPANAKSSVGKGLTTVKNKKVDSLYAPAIKFTG